MIDLFTQTSRIKNVEPRTDLCRTVQYTGDPRDFFDDLRSMGVQSKMEQVGRGNLSTVIEVNAGNTMLPNLMEWTAVPIWHHVCVVSKVDGSFLISVMNESEHLEAWQLRTEANMSPESMFTQINRWIFENPGKAIDIYATLSEVKR